jgi:hypothetical protein
MTGGVTDSRVVAEKVVCSAVLMVDCWTGVYWDAMWANRWDANLAHYLAGHWDVWTVARLSQC